MHVQHPHKLIISYLRVMELVDNRPFVQRAWNYMNDSFRTTVILQYEPPTIACSVIFLAARDLKISLKTSPPWWEVFGAELEGRRPCCSSLLLANGMIEDMERIAREILYIYLHPLPVDLPRNAQEMIAYMKRSS